MAIVVALAVPLSICVGGVALHLAMTSPQRTAIREAHAALRPGLSLRAALEPLSKLQEKVFVRVSQETTGATPIEWLGRRETLESFAATVRPGRPLRVDIAPFGSRQEFTIALDEAGAVRAVSPIEGHAD